MIPFPSGHITCRVPLVRARAPERPPYTAENGFENACARGRLGGMSTITVAIPDPLDLALAERMNDTGARSKEEYLLSLLEADCAMGGLERVLAERLAGPFVPLPVDWQEQVRQAARARA